MNTFKAIAGGILSILAVVLLMTYPTMWCWNYLMPDLFGLEVIGFKQAFVMSIFSSLLFKDSSVSAK